MIDAGRELDVLACYVHVGSGAVCFFDSLFGALAEDAARPGRGERRRLGEYHNPGGPYIQDNRARAARYFLEHTGYQWLWMLDNDMQFPPDTLYRLLDFAEKHDTRILAAAYWNRYSGPEPYLSWLNFDPDGVHAIPYVPDSGGKPIPITACGMGCTLIHRDALADVADMHAGDPWDTFGADILVHLDDGTFLTAPSIEEIRPSLNGRQVLNSSRLGEDVTLCLRARRCGYVTYGHPKLTVEHFKPQFLPHNSEQQMRAKADSTNGANGSPNQRGVALAHGEGSS